MLKQMADGQDGQTLFHGILQATPESLTITTAVYWHLKVRYRARCWSNKKLMHHSHHAKNQLNSYIHS